MTYILNYVTEARTGSIRKHTVNYEENASLFFLRGELARTREAYASNQTEIVDAKVYDDQTGGNMTLVEKRKWITRPVMSNGLVDKLKLSERR